jgi:hypothetical protein
MTINISESEYNRNRRLARIFAPYATQQIDEIYGDPAFSQLGSVSKRFVHYTAAEAALEIIKTKRFWMRNALCMADYREVQHGFDILRGFFADKSNAEAFYNAIDLFSPGAAKEAVDHFDRWLPDIRCNTYLACLSKHHDSEDTNGRLSMWRGFGGTATPRVAVVLKIPALIAVTNKSDQRLIKLRQLGDIRRNPSPLTVLPTPSVSLAALPIPICRSADCSERHRA